MDKYLVLFRGIYFIDKERKYRIIVTMHFKFLDMKKKIHIDFNNKSPLLGCRLHSKFSWEPNHQTKLKNLKSEGS